MDIENMTFDESSMPYNNIRYRIIEEIKNKLELSEIQSQNLEYFFEKKRILEISETHSYVDDYDDEPTLQTMTIDSLKLRGKDYKAYNIVLKWKDNPLGDISALFTSACSVAFGFDGKITLALIMMIFNCIFTGFSLAKIELDEIDTAIILALEKNKKENSVCFDDVNKILVSNGFDIISESQYQKAITKLEEKKCISVINGVLNLNEKVIDR